MKEVSNGSLYIVTACILAVVIVAIIGPSGCLYACEKYKRKKGGF